MKETQHPTQQQAATCQQSSQAPPLYGDNCLPSLAERISPPSPCPCKTVPGTPLLSSSVCPVWWMSCPPGSPGPCPCPLQLGPEPLGVGGEGVGGSRQPTFLHPHQCLNLPFPSKGSSKARQKASRGSQQTVVRAARSGWPGGLWGRLRTTPPVPTVTHGGLAGGPPSSHQSGQGMGDRGGVPTDIRIWKPLYWTRPPSA